MKKKFNLKGLEQEKLQEFFISINEKPFRARQVMKWIYTRGINEFQKMTDLSGPLRANLNDIASIESLKLDRRIKSNDGSEKFVFGLEDNHYIETVFIPTSERLTICISTQAGCPMGCTFCATGQNGFHRNLTSFEIIDQLLQVSILTNNLLKMTNIVFMGMGEPLLNFESLCDAIKIMESNFGFELGGRKISVSTCGIPDKIKELADTGLRVKLAISLNAPTDSIRYKIMPNSFKINEIIESAKYYAQKTNRWVTFEYVLINGINDSLENAKKLVQLIKGFQAKVNLIPYNPTSDISFKAPDMKTVLRFQAYLFENNITAIIRESRGTDIFGACGQLREQRPENQIVVSR